MIFSNIVNDRCGSRVNNHESVALHRGSKTLQCVLRYCETKEEVYSSNVRVDRKPFPAGQQSRNRRQSRAAVRGSSRDCKGIYTHTKSHRRPGQIRVPTEILFLGKTVSFLPFHQAWLFFDSHTPQRDPYQRVTDFLSTTSALA